ncbi:MAG: DUF2834 domain-containing protein [Cyanophyceae cyanobacterium]
MGSRLLFGLLWLGFTLYAFVFAPPDDSEATFALIQRLVSGDINGINPLIVAEFNLMGVLPLAYWCLLFVDGYRHKTQGSRLPAWPFSLLMMAVGAFSLLPYLALRQPVESLKDEGIPTPLPWTLRVWNSPWTGRALLVAAIALLGFGITQGDWGDFARQWQTSRFIHVMTLDFLLLSALLPSLIAEDKVGREPTGSLLSGIVNFLPLLGSLLYLASRPQIRIPESSELSGS